MAIDRIKWNELVNSNLGSAPYHLWEWGEICRTAGIEPIYIEDGGVLPLVFIKSFIFGDRLISMPFADHGGPLASSNENRLDLLRTAIREGKDRNVRSIEIRDVQESHKHIFEKLHFICRSIYVTFELDIARDEDALLAQMRKNIRNEIHKIERENKLIFKEVSAREDLKLFYPIYLETMRRHGSPQQSLEFFYCLWDELHSVGIFKLFFAIFENREVAAYTVMCYKKKLYHWSSVVTNDFRKLDPQTFLMWELIKWGKRNGYLMIDFGRTRPRTNIYFAKSGWGAEEMPLTDAFYFYGKKINPPDPESRLFKIASSVWRLLPSFVIKALGPKINSQIGL